MYIYTGLLALVKDLVKLIDFWRKEIVRIEAGKVKVQTKGMVV